MANSRLSMRKIFEVLRLSVADGRSHREIARAVDSSPTTVGEILRRAKLAGLSYPLPAGVSEAGIEALLYPPSAPSATRRPEPDWAGVQRELRRKGVTLDLLWQEYKSEHPDGYQYSSFCDHYRVWAGRLSLSLRQTHTPGEKLFVDYAGPTVPVTDPLTGEIRQAAIFVAVLGASNYDRRKSPWDTYCDATWSQALPDWIGSHVRALEFFGGVPAMLVPDNLKSGVNKACHYDPELNPSYRDLAVHYATAVVPARPYRPKDKAKVEAGVLLVERWVLARLRNQRFFSLSELNRHIAELMQALNRRPFKKLPGSRESAFAEMDRPALRPLPESRYEFAEWKVATVGIDYHVEIAGHYYSVPYRFARQKVDARFTNTTVELFHRGNRIASHVRSAAKGRHTTVDAHMTPAHQSVQGWNAPRLLDWAGRIGPHVKAVIEHVLHQRRHPQQGYRSCLGILRLSKAYGEARLEAACERAIDINALSYGSLKSILKHGLDIKRLTATAQTALPLDHANVRGPHYYH
ncbi:MAG: IS21 family transposase [Candidatus Dechloromonas phosphoritropha]